MSGVATAGASIIKLKPFDSITQEQDAILSSATANLLFCGQGGCGKSHTGVAKAFAIGAEYPNGCIALIRKKRVDLKATIWKYFIDKVLQPACNEHRRLVVAKNDTDLYRKLCNGTEFYGVGLDSPLDVNKLASREYNFVVIEEATELTEDDYDTKIIRTVRLPSSPFHQILSLCNPSSPAHWLYKRFYLSNDTDYEVIEGKTLPPPYLPARYYRFLEKLTGIFAARYRDGKWVGAEGVVYPFDPTKHVIPSFKIPADWRRVVCIDFGFALMHAFCCQFWAVSPSGKWYCYRQIYMTGKTVGTMAPVIRRYMIQDGIDGQEVICDHDAEDRATLNEANINTRPARKERIIGAQIVFDLIQKDHVFFFENSLVEEDIELKMAKLPYRTEHEFGYYTWANKDKLDMIHKLDHGVDCMRYGIVTTVGFIDDEGMDVSDYAPKVLQK